MLLTANTNKIRAYLGGAVATTQPSFYTCWVDVSDPSNIFDPGSLYGSLNGATKVEIVPAPSGVLERQVKLMNIFNLDSAAVTVTFQHFNGSVETTLAVAVLQPGERVDWEPNGTWHVYDVNGILKTSGGGGGGLSYLIVREIDGSPTVNATILEFDETAFAVVDGGGGIAQVSSLASGGGATRRVPGSSEAEAMADLPVGNEGSCTGATAVTALAAPAASKQRIIPQAGAAIYNADTVARDLTFQKNKGGTITVLQKTAAVPAGGLAVLSKRVVLDATNESLEVKTDAAAATTEPTFDVAALETS